MFKVEFTNEVYMISQLVLKGWQYLSHKDVWVKSGFEKQYNKSMIEKLVSKDWFCARHKYCLCQEEASDYSLQEAYAVQEECDLKEAMDKKKMVKDCCCDNNFFSDCYIPDLNEELELLKAENEKLKKELEDKKVMLENKDKEIKLLIDYVIAPPINGVRFK